MQNKKLLLSNLNAANCNSLTQIAILLFFKRFLSLSKKKMEGKNTFSHQDHDYGADVVGIVCAKHRRRSCARRSFE